MTVLALPALGLRLADTNVRVSDSDVVSVAVARPPARIAETVGTASPR